ncbi:MAG: 3-hydroxyacyl-CoA dehydrogenase NAD-binding domain-containing protein, partial [Panacagrimonas sp.]
MESVAYQLEQGVAVLTIDNPPVNALGQAVRRGLVDGLARAASDDAAKAVLLIGAGRTFVAGADIREFGAASKPPSFAEVLGQIEAMKKPVIAALHGTALGGGLELALTCHCRVAIASAKLGLPEVNLGLLPGAGGTQRLPRLAGPEKALEMMVSGKPIGATEALELGVIDQIVDGDSQADLHANALRFAVDCASRGCELPLARNKQDKVDGTDPALFDAMREKNKRRWHGQIAPWKIVDCVQAACEKPFDEGSAIEHASFEQCRNSPQSAAMRYAFFAEREAAKIPGLGDVRPKAIESAAVIGAGTMGGGIAMSFANAGIPVQLLDISDQALENGMAKIRGNYQTSVKRGSTSQTRMDRALSLISTSTQMQQIGQADIVVEAVFEEMQLKKDTFAKLDAVMKPGAVLASNTSTLSIDEIASATSRPQDVVGTHFFSPANVMRLQENVRGQSTSAETIVTVMRMAKSLGKVAVLAGNCEGFIGNRILHTYGRECDFMLEEGATPWQIDGALKAFGFPMGLYLMKDLAGLDVGWRVRKGQQATRDQSLRYSVIADRICEKGWFG